MAKLRARPNSLMAMVSLPWPDSFMVGSTPFLHYLEWEQKMYRVWLSFVLFPWSFYCVRMWPRRALICTDLYQPLLWTLGWNKNVPCFEGGESEMSVSLRLSKWTKYFLKWLTINKKKWCLWCRGLRSVAEHWPGTHKVLPCPGASASKRDLHNYLVNFQLK